MRLVVHGVPSITDGSSFVDSIAAAAADARVEFGAFVDLVSLRAVYRYPRRAAHEGRLHGVEWRDRAPSIASITASVLGAVRTSGLVDSTCTVVSSEIAKLTVDHRRLWIGCEIVLSRPGEPETVL